MATNAKLVIVECSEFKEKIAKTLERSGLKLCKLYQLDNKLLKIKFEQELENISRTKPNGFDGNILHLYHGTAANLEYICEEGLDERLSRKGRFGKGIYFSDDPSKCCKYAEKKPKEKNYILICKVILGDTKEYPDGKEDRSLIKEPLKEVVEGKRVYYDSVKGKPCQHTEYVIYEKRRMLIEYVAYYEKDDNFQHKKSYLSNSVSGSSDNSDSSSENDDDNTLQKCQLKENLEIEKKAALMQLAQMKHMLKKEDFDELIQSYQATYGQTELLEKSLESEIRTPLEDKICLEKMRQFSSITNCTDLCVCKVYLENNKFILEDALNSYFDCN